MPICGQGGKGSKDAEVELFVAKTQRFSEKYDVSASARRF